MGANFRGQLSVAPVKRAFTLLALATIVLSTTWRTPAQPALSFVQVNSATPQSSPSTVNVQYTSAQTAGNLNVVVVGWNDTTAQVQSVVDSVGNVYQLAVGPTIRAGSATQSIYYAANIAAAAANANTVTVTFNTGASYPDIRIAEYQGVATTNPVDVTAAATGSSSLSDSGSVVTTNANDLLIGANIVQKHTTAAGVSYTSRVITSPDGDILEDAVVTATGSYNATASTLPSSWYIMQMVAFRAASADTQPPTAPGTPLLSVPSSSQISLTWPPATDDIGVTGYLVERCAGSSCSAFAQIGTSASPSFNDAGLTPSSSYSYRVRATDAAGNLGPYSTIASAITQPPPSISFVQVNSATPQGPTAVVAVPFTAAQAAADLNVVVVGWNDANATVQSVADTSGNIYSLAVGPTVVAGAATQSIYYAANIASAAANANVVTVTFTTPAGSPDVRIAEYRGIATASPVDVTAAAQGNSALTDSGAVATANPNDLLVGANMVQTHATDAGASYTLRVITSPDGDILEDRVVASAGSYNATSPLWSPGWWIMQLVAFRAASSDTQAPSAPGTPVPAVVSSTQINLTWAPATDNIGVTGYLIERCAGAGCSTFAQVGTTSTTTFSNTGLSGSTTYTYRIRATDAASNLGPYSATASATTSAPLDTQPPSAPGSPVPTVISTTQINLTWAPATDNVGVTGYLIERCAGAGCSTFAQIGTPSTAVFIDTGLTASTTYSYRVRATDAAGNLGPYSATASATTQSAPDIQPPTAPGTPALTVASSSQINLTWPAATDNVAVTGYFVERCAGTGCSTFSQIGATPTTSFNDIGLTAFTNYSYRVRATDAASNVGPYSVIVSATTQSPPAISFVQMNWATPQSTVSSVPVTFTAPQTAGNLNVVVVGWNDASAAVQSVTDTLGNIYSRAVGPTVIAGSATQSIYYAPGIAATAANGNTVTVTFAPGAVVPDIRIAEYSGIAASNPVDVTAAAQGTGTLSDSGASVTTSANDLLVGANTVQTHATGPGTSYTQRAITSPDGDILEDRIVTSAGSYNASAPMTSGWWIMQMVAFRGATADTTPPTAPGTPALSVISSSQINLAWTAATDDVGVTGYLVERCAGVACSSFTQIGSPATPNYGDTGLNASTSYSYRLRATDAAGNLGPYSATSSATTPAPSDTQPPTAPGTPILNVVSSTQIIVTWPPATDNVGVTGYRLERCAGSGCNTFVQIATPATNGFNDTGLTPSTPYSYRVCATDAASNIGSYSATATATTIGLPDLTISKSHAGNFTQGQNGAAYTLTVTNVGTAPTTSAVTVTDTLPAGLTATSLTGTGWNCSLGTLSCTRADALSASTNYPSITLTVNVSATAPASVTNIAAVSGGGEVDTTDDTAADLTTISPSAGPSPPAFVTEAHFSVDQRTTSANKITMSLNVTGTNTLLLAAMHVEFDGGDTNWIATDNGVTGTLLVNTDGYTGGAGNQRFRIYYWLNPPAGNNTVIIQNSYNGPNELTGSAVLLSNVSQSTPLGAITLDVSTTPRTSESETVVATAGDLVMHVIADAEVVRGTLGPGETSVSIANDGSHTLGDGDASLWISTKPGASPTTTVSSSGWPSAPAPSPRVMNGVGLVLHGAGSIVDTQPPTAPAALSATAISSTEIDLNWTASTDNVGVAGYMIERCQGVGCSNFAQIAAPSATTFANTGVSASASYSYRVRATDAAGNLSAYSNTATTFVVDTQPPSVPGTLSATPVSGTQVSLSWGPATDNVGVTGYIVQRCQSAGCSNFAIIGTPSATSFNDSGLTANTSYTYVVAARDAANNVGPNSNAASVTTPAINPNLVAAFSFNEGSGTTVGDGSGHGNTGTITGATWTAAGKYGSALVFNGATSRVTINDSPSLHLINGLTLEAWVNPSVALSGWDDIIYRGNDDYFLLLLNGTPVAGITLSTDSSSSNTFASTGLPLNTWTHIAQTFDGSTVRLFVNGTQVASSALVGSVLDSTQPLEIGSDHLFGQYFQGLIDEIRVYNVALTQSQIQSDLATPVGP